MEANPFHRNSEPAYSDEQVIKAVRDHGGGDQLVLRWFFNNAREYALGYLIKLYPRLESEEWDVVFANANLKIVRRFRKGLRLKEGTSLMTYYTSVVKFSALDFVRDLQERQYHQEVEEHQAVVTPKVQEDLEQSERSLEIRRWLDAVIGNEEQVNILLLHAKGFSYREMLEKTSYKSEGACRNAFLKGKKKITEFLLKHPTQAKKLRQLLEK